MSSVMLMLTERMTPESLPPRRMTRLRAGPHLVERVFAVDYKAATLTVDEVVLGPGQPLAVRDIPERPPHEELLVFVRAEADATVHAGAETITVTGDAAFAMATAGGDTEFAVSAGDGRCYLLFAYAGK